MQFVSNSVISSVEGPASPKTTQTTEHKTTIPPTDPILPLSLAAAIVLVTLCLTFTLCKMKNSCKTSGTLHFNTETHLQSWKKGSIYCRTEKDSVRCLIYEGFIIGSFCDLFFFIIILLLFCIPLSSAACELTGLFPAKILKLY